MASFHLLARPGHYHLFSEHFLTFLYKCTVAFTDQHGSTQTLVVALRVYLGSQILAFMHVPTKNVLLLSFTRVPQEPCVLFFVMWQLLCNVVFIWLHRYFWPLRLLYQKSGPVTSVGASKLQPALIFILGMAVLQP